MSLPGEARLEVFISQRILTRYREDAFFELSRRPGLSVYLAFGDRDHRRPFAKYSSIKTTPRFPHARLWTLSLIFERFGHVNQFFFSPGILWRLLRRRPDVVLTEGSSNILNNLLTCGYCLLGRRPYVWWDLGLIRGQKSRNPFRRLLTPVIHFFMRRAAVLLGYSSHSAEGFRSLGLPERRIVVAGNTLRLERHERARAERVGEAVALAERLGLKDAAVFLAVGGLEQAKRFDQLIRAFLSLAADRPEAALVIVGDGPERESLQALLADSPAAGRVHFAGAQFEDVDLYFMIARVLCQPGLGGLAINEAMAHGLAIIAGPADGTELDLVRERETGFLIGRDAEADLAKRMVWTLEHPEETRDMGVRGREFIHEHYSLEAMVDRIELALRRAAGGEESS